MKLIIIVLVFISLLLLVGCKFSRKLLYFPAPVSSLRQSYLKAKFPNVEELELIVDKNIKLHGWFIKKDINTLSTIFYFGGNAEEVSLNIEEYNQKVDANVVLVNYRGFGKSQGSPAEEDLKSDALKIYAYVTKKYGLKREKNLAWGRSIGSSMACYLAFKENLPKLILTCPFDSIENVASSYYPRPLVNLVLQDKHRTNAFANQIQSQILVIASENDEVIPFKHTLNLYNSLQGDKKLVYLNQAGHNTISEYEAYYEAVDRFLK